MDAMGWSSSTTFQKVYLKDVLATRGATVARVLSVVFEDIFLNRTDQQTALTAQEELPSPLVSDLLYTESALLVVLLASLFPLGEDGDLLGSEYHLALACDLQSTGLTLPVIIWH